MDITKKKLYLELPWYGKIFRICELTVKRFCQQELGMLSTALTYCTLFAIVPVLALVFGFTRGFRWEAELKAELLNKFAEHADAIKWIFDFAERALNRASSSVVAGVGVLFLVVTLFFLANNIDKAFNQIWALPARRGAFRKLSDSISILILTPTVIVLASSGGVMLHKFIIEAGEKHPKLQSLWGGILPISSMVLPFVLSIAVFTLIYRKAPNTKVRFVPAMLGGVLGGILYQLLQWGFLYAQTALSSYNAVYGSFAALPLLLIFLNLSWNIVLLGAEFSFICQNAGSGQFELFERRYSKWQFMRYQLLIVRYLLRSFELGKKPPRQEDLVNALEFPPFLVHILLNELIAANVVRSVAVDGGTGYQPARPAKYMTIWFVFKSILTGGKNIEDEQITGEIDWVNQNLCKLEEAIKICPYNRHLDEF